MKMRVGKKIKQSLVDGDVIIQTPGYLKPNVWNMIDEFQFLTEFNKAFIETLNNYTGKTILSSATVHGPLLRAMELNSDFQLNICRGTSVRSKPRHIIWSNHKFDASRTPDNSIMFTTAQFNYEAYPNEEYPA